MKERLLWLVFVVILACAVAAVVGWWLRRSSSRRAPDFALVERSGRQVTRRALLGEVWVADFVFTRCQWSCPRMNSVMHQLQARVPAAKYVSFSVDPAHDTPARLAEWVETNRLAKDGWLWLSGVPHEEMQRVAQGFLLPAGDRGDGPMDILHSERFVLVDRYGRMRGTYPVVEGPELRRNEEALGRLEADLRRVLAEPHLPVTKIPTINAGFNALSAFLLIAGLGFIKAGRAGAHRACMLAALGSSTLFLAGYLTAHHYLGSTPYPGQGTMRTVYLAILLSHTVLAALIVPLAGITVARAFRGRFDRHKAIARWTLPIWLYVSVTGVVIYFMLYG